VPTYYFKEDATGAADGSSAADGFTTFAAVDGVLAAGDEVRLCKQDDGTGAKQAWTLSVAGAAGSTITVVGCDSAGTPLGPGSPVGNASYFDIDGESTRANGTAAGNKEYYSWQFIRWKNHTSHGFTITGGTDYHAFFDCAWLDNGGSGVTLGIRSVLFYRCCFDGNSISGVEDSINCTTVACWFTATGLYGLGNSLTNSRIDGCTFVNMARGVNLGTGSNSDVIGCTFVDMSTEAIRNSGVANRIKFCLFHTCVRDYVDAAGSDWAWWDRNYTYNRTNANTVNGELITGIADVSLGSDPFVNKAGGDYTIASGSAARNIETYYDANNSSWRAAGALEPEETAGGGGRIPRIRLHGA